MARVAFFENDNLLELTGLKNVATGAFINTATVQVTVTDLQGTNVTGATWPLAMAFVAGSNGDYRATLADTLGFVNGRDYIAVMTASGGAGLDGKWRFRFSVRTRTG